MRKSKTITARFFRSMLALLAVVTLMTGEAYAETFEFLTYSPPRGWVSQPLQDGIAYRRAEGIGLIALYASYPANGSPSDEFVKMWRARVEPTIQGTAPKPELQRDGDYTAAIASTRVNAKDTVMSVSLVVFVGRGRTLGVLAMSAGEDVFREVTAFFDSVKITSGKTAVANPGPAASGEIAVDFDVPPGYVSQREGANVLLTPKTVDDTTPCAYGISPSRASTGDLEKDTRAALGELFPGWQTRTNSSYAAMRGVGGGGWPYFWYRTDVERLSGGKYDYANIMATAFSGARGQVNILFGIGSISNCRLNDINFARIFHSLQPRGWYSDGGKALAGELRDGIWRLTERGALAQYKFKAAGRYEYGMAADTSVSKYAPKAFSTVRDGNWQLRGSELILTPDGQGQGVEKYKVRVYDEMDSFSQRWKRAMSLLNENAKPALEVQYMRIDE